MNNVIFEDLDADVNHLNYLYPSFSNNEQSTYYDTNKFNADIPCNGNNFSVLNLNIRSITANIDPLNAFLSTLNTKFDILSFTESWLTDETRNLIFLNNYNSLHCLRSSKRGGGISIFVKNSISFKRIESCSLSLPFIESLFMEIKHRDKKLIIATVYKPPKGNDDLFIDKLIEFINFCKINSLDEFILCGDFNYNLLELNNNTTLRFLTSMNTFSIHPLITKPTRITDTSATLLDNIFIRNPLEYTAGLLNIDISDHLPIFLVKQNFFLTPKSNDCISIKYRIINDETLYNMYNMLIYYDFSEIIDNDDCSHSVSKLTDILYETFDTCCPIKEKTISPKRFKKPWITRKILINIKKRQNYFTLFKQGKLSKDVYSRFRNYVNSQIRNAKKDYYKKLFDKFQKDTKATWKTINNILKPNHTTKSKLIKKIMYNNENLTENLDIANAFNDFFCNIGKEITKNITIENNNIDHVTYLNEINVVNSFFFKPSNTRDIMSIISSLKNKKSHLNVIPTSVLKFLSNILSPILSHIINKSIEKSQFPDILKNARVTPIYKAGEKSNISNYRPISVLPIISKIFEKFAYNQIYEYFNNNNFFFSNQYGFRSRMGTNQAILNHLQYLYDHLDSGKIVFSLFLDFKKAFDSVDHKILLSKLNLYGIRGDALNWFESYLSNRHQITYVNKTYSNSKIISHGVPQGSILGPLLFLIFINDIHKCTNFFKFILFADDSTLSSVIPNTDLLAISNTINSELNNLNLWLMANKLCINDDKTKYILFSYRRKIKLPLIKIGSYEILETDNTKFLGIFIDKSLTFKNHSNYLRQKISKSIGILYKLNKFLPNLVMQKLYFTLVYPYFLYAIEAWHSTYENTTRPLLILQKKAIRAIFNLEFRSHTNDYFKNMSTMKLPDLFKFQTCIYLYKTLNSENFDPTLNYSLEQNFNLHDHNIRNNAKLSYKNYNLKKSKFNIKHHGPKIYNSIPEKIVTVNSLYKFKRELKKYFISQY